MLTYNRFSISEVLNLARCRLRGGFPIEIYSLTNLRVLDVSGNKMSSTISDDIANLMQLQDFHVHFNFFSGTFPSHFPTTIRSFRISSNDFTGNPWAMLATWPNVQYFDVSNTPTYGSIPTGIGLLTNLVGIESQMANLEGTIPSEIGYLTNLAAFDSPNCGLTGTIPSELGLCTKLTSLTLSTNSFDSASIPTVLGSMTQLKILTLNGLSFTGTIPTELIRLVNLEELLLNDNFLTGTIPVGWNGIIQGQGMDRIWLDFNLLTGPLPAHFCPRELHVDCEVGCGSCMACACV
jgi:Leucine-rich repeat (LRR) protein